MQFSRKQSIIAYLLGFVLFILGIQLIGSIKGNELVFPGIVPIIKRFFQLLIQGKTYQLIGTTFLHLAEALVLSSFIGIAIGTAEGFSPFLRCALKPVLVALRSIPMILLVIMIMVLTHYDQVPITATSLVLIPIISEAVAEGIRNIDPELTDVYKMNSRFTIRVFFSVHLPLIAGYLRQSYANAIGMGLKVAVTSEYLVQAKHSLGKAVYSSFYFSEYQDIYAYALIMIMLVIVATGFFPFVIRRVFQTGDEQ